jgi:hypothetical protein
MDLAGYPGLPDPRGVDQDVQPTQRIDGLSECLGDHGGLAHVASQPRRVQIVRRGSGVIGRNDLGAGCAQHVDRSRPDPGRAAGHQDPLAF